MTISSHSLRFARIRRAIRVRGVVQGVGFRPSMFRLADSLRLAGFVRNDDDQVLIEIEGDETAVQRFVDRLPAAAPSLARLEGIELRDLAPRGTTGFSCETTIEGDRPTPATAIPSDLPPCSDCLREIDDPGDRRHRYPFAACASCGPRFSIVRRGPYDRERTAMVDFPLCAECRQEYSDPSNRRFHAEANACPGCGPRLEFISDGRREVGPAALSAAIESLERGAIVAVKAVGGFVLAVSATNEDAVDRLRAGKRRPRKPFAVMARDVENASRIAVMTEEAQEELGSLARPIVLLPKRSDSPLARGVAPMVGDVGVFLPPSPLQHILLNEGPPLQVMTSGNAAGDVIVTSNAEAIRKLGAIADAFLMHDREILHGVDDSVVRMVAGAPLPIRRARGFVPAALQLPVEGPPLLAAGGELKSTVCFAHRGRAVLSPHIGDLDHLEAHERFVANIADLGSLFATQPVAIVHDMHPDYRSSIWAEQAGLPTIAVQHHHAHIAACMAEHGRKARVIGVAFDGTGYGSDGGLWGGEFLEASLGDFMRLGYLRPLAMPGGENAIFEPWRLAVAALIDAGAPADVLTTVAARDRDRVSDMVRNVSTTTSTSAGRWFDVAAALCGFSGRIDYEAQAAIELEAMTHSDTLAPYDLSVEDWLAGPFVIDMRPVVRGIVRDLCDGAGASVIATRFHETMAHCVLLGCQRARGDGAPNAVALSGGCFQNRRLTERARALLEEDGFEVLVHRRVPPNDGGLSFGQAAVASARLAGRG